MSLLYSIYQQPIWTMTGLVIVAIWTLIWKGVGLWYAGKNQQRNWFIAILILNTAGLLPIIYLLWFKPENGVVKEKVNNSNKDGNKDKKDKKDKKVDRKVDTIEGEIIEISEDQLKEELSSQKTKEKSVKKNTKKSKISKEINQ